MELSDAAVVVGTGTEPKASKSVSSRSAGAEDGTGVGVTVGATGEINPIDRLRDENQSKSTIIITSHFMVEHKEKNQHV